mmetsp:Transcript_46292/g.113585  ORF Transcript_46292/g.113585 Transcript_46292/m.113585 type:complete len:200 (+) Transcript_46292:861-1460(+)
MQSMSTWPNAPADPLDSVRKEGLRDETTFCGGFKSNQPAIRPSRSAYVSGRTTCASVFDRSPALSTTATHISTCSGEHCKTAENSQITTPVAGIETGPFDSHPCSLRGADFNTGSNCTLATTGRPGVNITPRLRAASSNSLHWCTEIRSCRLRTPPLAPTALRPDSAYDSAGGDTGRPPSRDPPRSAIRPPGSPAAAAD